MNRWSALVVDKLKRYSWLGATVAILLPLAGSVAISLLLPPQRWINVPMHSVLECMGGVLAMTVGAILLSRNSQSQAAATDIWFACSLFAMGTIDLFHAATAPGNLFVWLHSLATVSGGVLMSLVWISSLAGVPHVSRTWPWCVLLAALAAGMVSCGAADRIPTMVVDGQFTAFPRYVHILGGIGFFVAAAVFIRRFCRTLDLENWLFAVNTQLFGFASIMFDWSTVWDGGWWWWHAIRLLAYGMLAVFAVTTFLKSEQQLRVLNHQLLDWNAELDGTLAERTAALKASEGQFRQLVEASPTGLLVVERSGKILLSNSEARRLFGYAPGELEGQSIENLVPTAIRAAHAELRDGFFARPTARLMGAGQMLSARRKDGSEFPAEIAITVAETTSGPAALCGVADLTLRQQTLETLEAARDAAEAANHAKSDFLANMSHEIRTPMHHVIGLAELALGTPLTPVQQTYLSLIVESAESLMTIINEILDFSTIEAGQLRLDNLPFNLRASLGDTMKALAHRADGRGLKLKFHVEDDVPDDLVGDPVHLRQILLNLVSNAIVFTERGEVNVAIRQLERRDDDVLLEGAVSDSGIGIPPEKLDVIFQAFAQADTSTTRRVGGTGLGLSICQRLVGLMRGRLWVESQVGQGSTFRFNCWMKLGEPVQERDLPTDPQTAGARATTSTPLPVDHLAVDRLAVDRRAVPDQTPGAPPAVAPQIPALKILVVDDGITNQRLAVGILKKWGHAVHVASNGREAVEAYESNQFDLILMDIQMPEMDGLEATTVIRQRERETGRRVPIVALTAHALKGDEQMCFAAGMDHFLAKPLRQTQLLEVLLGISMTAHLRCGRAAAE